MRLPHETQVNTSPTEKNKSVSVVPSVVPNCSWYWSAIRTFISPKIGYNPKCRHCWWWTVKWTMWVWHDVRYRPNKNSCKVAYFHFEAGFGCWNQKNKTQPQMPKKKRDKSSAWPSPRCFGGHHPKVVGGSSLVSITKRCLVLARWAPTSYK